jgi:SAM-dependent methyltransferase
MDEELKARLREAYDLKAADRDRRTISDWRLRPRNDFAALLKREGKQTLLELGSGPGNDGRYFHDEGFDVLCTDLSPEHVRLCQQKGLKARVMDNTNIDLPAASFDAAFAMNSLLHLPKRDLPAVLERIETVLKPDGLFFVGVYGGIDSEGIHQDDDHKPKRFFAFYSDDNLKRILSAVFRIESFAAVSYEDDNPDMHWQAAVLRRD